jgi:hypothetical protein
MTIAQILDLGISLDQQVNETLWGLKLRKKESKSRLRIDESVKHPRILSTRSNKMICMAALWKPMTHGRCTKPESRMPWHPVDHPVNNRLYETNVLQRAILGGICERRQRGLVSVNGPRPKEHAKCISPKAIHARPLNQTTIRHPPILHPEQK